MVSKRKLSCSVDDFGLSDYNTQQFIKNNCKRVLVIRKQPENHPTIKIKNFDSNIIKLGDPDFLVVSDIHLGARDCNLDLFEDFLVYIKDNYLFGHEFKGIIILGDFFDLLAANYRDLASNPRFKKVYSMLGDFQENGKIKMYLTFGNHEISVSGTLDEKFPKRKQAFLNKFADENFAFIENLNNRGGICQYILLRRKFKSKILTLDSISSISNKIGNNIDNKQVPFRENKSNSNIFLTHGHQFHGKIARNFNGAIWTSLRHSSKFVKSAIDFLYSSYKKKAKSLFEIKEYLKFQLMNCIKKDEINEISNGFESIVNNETSVESNKKFDKNIMNFVINNEELKDVSQVIYGHTHSCQEEVQYEQDGINVRISNTGCWKHAQNRRRFCKNKRSKDSPKPSFIEVYIR